MNVIQQQRMESTVCIYVLNFICVCCDSQLPDKDLQQRRSTQKVDPMTGEIYGKDIYDPEKPKPKKEVCC